ncbi:MAG TPA: protease complex subunit PrcB family protein [Bryobacteraceae bacterium]|nr:protease complex subunit PrcB family protein [Bryobacteraceae bacterium]
MRTAWLFAIFALQSVQGSAGAIEFESLGRASPVGSDPRVAAVYIVQSLENVAKLPEVITAEHRKAIGGLDYSSRLVIAVFRGEVGTGGYSITVLDIKVEQQRLEITAELTNPAKDSMTTFGFSSPYHLVAVPKAKFAEARIGSWLLRDKEGRVLAESKAGLK